MSPDPQNAGQREGGGRPRAWQPGYRVADRYEIVREAGRGGMGVVYEAVDCTLHRRVAIKRLPSGYAADTQAAKRFLAEARAAAAIGHPGIVPVYDAGEKDGVYYMVMGYMPGRALAEVIRERGPLDVTQALTWMREIAETLGHMHGLGILHRDIKPQNILLDGRGQPRVSDFGLAKVQESATHLTAPGARLGTPLYMAPEQAQGGPVDARTDVYALGLTLFELLTGKSAVERSNPAAVVYQTVYVPVPDVRSLRPEVPEAVARLVAAMTAKKPDDRPESMAAVCARIDACLVVPATVPAEAAPAWRDKAVVAAIGLLAAAALLYGLLRGGGGTSPRISAPPAGARAGDVASVDLGGGETLDLVWCPPGTFTMGSDITPEEVVARYGGKTIWHEGERPQHPVTLTQGFWLGRCEVTQGQWLAVMGNNPSSFTGDMRRPVEQVSWDDCQGFLRRLNTRVRGSGRFRLPAEAEWEYACRAGTQTTYSCGDDAATLGDHACYWERSEKRPDPVGSRKPNAWGLCDMHGNVFEWCQDWYGEYPAGAVTDPTGPTSGDSRVARSGTWKFGAAICRSAQRAPNKPDYRDSTAGFRVALTP